MPAVLAGPCLATAFCRILGDKMPDNIALYLPASMTRDAVYDSDDKLTVLTRQALEMICAAMLTLLERPAVEQLPCTRFCQPTEAEHKSQHVPKNQGVTSPGIAKEADRKEIQQLLRKDLIVHVGRVMVKRIPAFQVLLRVAVWHIPHEFQEEMAQKSEQNVSSEMAEVLKHFHQYVPAEMDPEGRISHLLLTIVLGGDWLSMEKAYNVQLAFSDGDDPV
uniref:Uncharacterized protein n=1 Tax=Branchiostoma floridae TaxID=7739 RepID=C3XT23_BRAFL|eukprot:XP_002612747.1 hypothetical protein BRAFLDRAFT_97273 [Branchiostoma floridae]